MSYQLTPIEELKKRVDNLQKKITELELDGVLLTNNVEIFYYSGSMQNSMMYIPAAGEPVLFVKKSVERAMKETLFSVEPMLSVKDLPQLIDNRGLTYRKVGIELDVLPYNQFQRIQRAFNGTDFSDISQVTRLQRSIKSNFEIEALRQSAEVVNEAILEVPKILKKGMKEFEFQAELERFVRLRGHLGYIRTRGYNMELVLGMVASGISAAVPTSFDGPAGGQGISPAMPQGAGWNEIKENEPILIDIAAAVNGYIVDQTRMAVIGDLDQELEHAYQTSLEIIKEIETSAKPGTTWSEHFETAKRLAKEAGLEEHFMGYKQNKVKFVGHGVGLELDELPILAKGLDRPLEAGMVIAIEPKFTFPNKGVIGIENTYVVTETGLELITIAPQEIIRLPK
ncbi:hypothetical protein BHF71_06845 [Vulcanibacillus modesticaldus]|uniref:Peptidase M24 n=1 Tax=Vulcanibacillus modesticaldus TaxID=337097 RepID=A0A1D2YWH0_9BACI|nr:Xaa-Pro peptidase family protein [Vulcanibacillus modesticaldus]OEF99985.1 hypothetical protein BHF71_06845 [Vulcanibacillus modesticaldus]